MKFSIVTPTRNCLDKVKRCVGSVRGQSYASYEHIIQDACSTDGTSQWLMAQSDLIIRSELDDGMYDAINRGWSRACGDVLSWLNADEQYLPGTIRRVSQILKENPELDFVYGNAIVVDSMGRAIAARREIPLRSIYIRNSFLNGYSCTMFFRRRLFDKGLLKLDARYKYAADMDLLLTLLTLKVRHYHIKRYLALFGVDGNNLSAHEEMQSETEEIRMKYNGSKSALVRRLVILGRYAERMLAGSYSSKRLSYHFAIDEIPTYQSKSWESVGGRYSLKGVDNK